MKIVKQCMWLPKFFLLLPILTSCAAGSATAGYALRAKEAECLTAEGEQRVASRVKRELMLEFCNREPTSPYAQPNY